MTKKTVKELIAKNLIAILLSFNITKTNVIIESLLYVLLTWILTFKTELTADPNFQNIPILRENSYALYLTNLINIGKYATVQNINWAICVYQVSIFVWLQIIVSILNISFLKLVICKVSALNLYKSEIALKLNKYAIEHCIMIIYISIYFGNLFTMCIIDPEDSTNHVLYLDESKQCGSTMHYILWYILLFYAFISLILVQIISWLNSVFINPQNHLCSTSMILIILEYFLKFLFTSFGLMLTNVTSYTNIKIYYTCALGHCVLMYFVFQLTRPYYNAFTLKIKQTTYILNSVIILANILSRETSLHTFSNEMSAYIFILLCWTILSKINLNILDYFSRRELLYYGVVLKSKTKIRENRRVKLQKRMVYYILYYVDLILSHQDTHYSEQKLYELVLITKPILDKHKKNCEQQICFCQDKINYSEFNQIPWPTHFTKDIQNWISYLLIIVKNAFEDNMKNDSGKSLIVDYIFYLCCFYGKSGIACQLITSAYRFNNGDNSVSKFSILLAAEMIKFSLRFSLVNGYQLYWNRRILEETLNMNFEYKNSDNYTQEKSASTQTFKIEYYNVFQQIKYFQKYKDLFIAQLNLRLKFYKVCIDDESPKILTMILIIEEFEKNDKNIDRLFDQISEMTNHRFESLQIVHINYQHHIRLNIQRFNSLQSKLNNIQKMSRNYKQQTTNLMLDSDGVVMVISGDNDSTHNITYLSRNCEPQFGYKYNELNNLDQIMPKPFITFHQNLCRTSEFTGSILNRKLPRKIYFRNKDHDLQETYMMIKILLLEKNIRFIGFFIPKRDVSKCLIIDNIGNILEKSDTVKHWQPKNVKNQFHMNNEQAHLFEVYSEVSHLIQTNDPILDQPLDAINKIGMSEKLYAYKELTEGKVIKLKMAVTSDEERQEESSIKKKVMDHNNGDINENKILVSKKKVSPHIGQRRASNRKSNRSYEDSIKSKSPKGGQDRRGTFDRSMTKNTSRLALLTLLSASKTQNTISLDSDEYLIKCLDIYIRRLNITVMIVTLQKLDRGNFEKDIEKNEFIDKYYGKYLEAFNNLRGKFKDNLQKKIYDRKKIKTTKSIRKPNQNGAKGVTNEQKRKFTSLIKFVQKDADIELASNNNNKMSKHSSEIIDVENFYDEEISSENFSEESSNESNFSEENENSAYDGNKGNQKKTSKVFVAKNKTKNVSNMSSKLFVNIAKLNRKGFVIVITLVIIANFVMVITSSLACDVIYKQQEHFQVHLKHLFKYGTKTQSSLIKFLWLTEILRIYYEGILTTSVINDWSLLPVLQDMTNRMEVQTNEAFHSYSQVYNLTGLLYDSVQGNYDLYNQTLLLQDYKDTHNISKQDKNVSFSEALAISIVKMTDITNRYKLKLQGIAGDFVPIGYDSELDYKEKFIRNNFLGDILKTLQDYISYIEFEINTNISYEQNKDFFFISVVAICSVQFIAFYIWAFLNEVNKVKNIFMRSLNFNRIYVENIYKTFQRNHHLLKNMIDDERVPQHHIPETKIEKIIGGANQKKYNDTIKSNDKNFFRVVSKLGFYQMLIFIAIPLLAFIIVLVQIFYGKYMWRNTLQFLANNDKFDATSIAFGLTAFETIKFNDTLSTTNGTSKTLYEYFNNKIDNEIINDYIGLAEVALVDKSGVYKRQILQDGPFCDVIQNCQNCTSYYTRTFGKDINFAINGFKNDIGSVVSDFINGNRQNSNQEEYLNSIAFIESYKYLDNIQLQYRQNVTDIIEEDIFYGDYHNHMANLIYMLYIISFCAMVFGVASIWVINEPVRDWLHYSISIVYFFPIDIIETNAILKKIINQLA